MLNTLAAPAPGILLGPYPEQRAPQLDRWTHLWGQLRTVLPRLQRTDAARYRRFASQVTQLEGGLRNMAQPAVDQRVQCLRAALSRDGFTDTLVVEAFALVRLLCERTLGRRPYDTQLIAARIMLDNRLAEMATGEGKTLAAAICAATAALAGVPVHVITVNDYLVARDAESLRPLYHALGLSVGHVVTPLDAATRQRAYACDVTYCTARELVFDYLRDRTVRNTLKSDLHRQVANLAASASHPPTLLRGLCMAVVDEADSILIDEAGMPLILSAARPNPGQTAFYAQALAFARSMDRATDYKANAAQKEIALTAAGRAKLDAYAQTQTSAWRNRLCREEAVHTALTALHLYQPDTHYLVQQRRVVIIDESTGRLAHGRVWSRGLHQMIELKEGCEPTVEQVTATQITYQRFFRRYLKLGGMSGTLREARAELAAVYQLDVVAVPLRSPSIRKYLFLNMFSGIEALQQAVVHRAQTLSAAGRPVLIGTGSVAESEALSQRLSAAGLTHAVLNAKHDAIEAGIIAQAGQAGQITVATNMAGRGTDIPLGPGVAERGGLHVINCQYNGSRRIDRQLLGRCARQGDPGSAESLLALDIPRLARFVPAWLARRIPPEGLHRPGWLLRLIARVPQWRHEQIQRRERAGLLRADMRVERDSGGLGWSE